MLLTLLIAVVKYLTRNNYRKEGYILALVGMLSIMMWKAWQKQHEPSGHTVSPDAGA